MARPQCFADHGCDIRRMLVAIFFGHVTGPQAIPGVLSAFSLGAAFACGPDVRTTAVKSPLMHVGQEGFPSLINGSGLQREASSTA